MYTYKQPIYVYTYVCVCVCVCVSMTWASRRRRISRVYLESPTRSRIDFSVTLPIRKFSKVSALAYLLNKKAPRAYF